jgi:C-terminal processing protease CtpA/Prc
VDVRAEQTTDDVRIAFELVSDEPERMDGPGTLAVTLAEGVVRGSASVVFEHVPAGGEAERAGIEPGDRLLGVGEARVRSIDQARRLLTGPLSEDLLLTLGRDPDFQWIVRVSRERVRR